MNDGDLKFWHIPQIPGEPLELFVSTNEEGVLLIDPFSAYEIFQAENGIKPDFANASGLQIFEEGMWVDW